MYGSAMVILLAHVNLVSHFLSHACLDGEQTGGWAASWLHCANFSGWTKCQLAPLQRFTSADSS